MDQSQTTFGPALDHVYPGSDLISVSGQGNPDLSKLRNEKDSNTMSGGLFVRALALFCSLWQGKYGKPYRPTAGDRNQFGRVLRELTREDLGELHFAFTNYLDDLSPWVAQSHRHSLQCFCTSGGFNKYRVAAPVVSDKEARSQRATEAFINGGKK